MRPRKVNPDLLKLQEEWDAKLKASGFTDAEDRQTGRLKRSAGSSSLLQSEVRGTAPLKGRLSGTSSRASKQDTAAYYRLACAFQWDHPFTSEVDRAVWAQHADGQTKRAISGTLAVPMSLVTRTIHRLRHVMLGTKAPYWTTSGRRSVRNGRRSDEGKK